MSESIHLINGIPDVFMFCDSPNCSCENICCQECDNTESCADKCDNFKFKEKMYYDDDHLIKTLNEHAEKQDDWLMAFAAQRLEVAIAKTRAVSA